MFCIFFIFFHCRRFATCSMALLCCKATKHKTKRSRTWWIHKKNIDSPLFSSLAISDSIHSILVYSKKKLGNRIDPSKKKRNKYKKNRFLTRSLIMYICAMMLRWKNEKSESFSQKSEKWLSCKVSSNQRRVFHVFSFHCAGCKELSLCWVRCWVESRQIVWFRWDKRLRSLNNIKKV